MGRRVDYFDDPAAPVATGRVPGVVAAVIDDDGRLLLVRRVDNGMWVMPGGAIELGESIAAAAAREVREETGVQIEVTGVVGLYTDPGHIIAYDNSPDPAVVLQEFSITLRARRCGGEAVADASETSEVRWVAPSELAGLDLHPVMRRRIQDASDPNSSPVIA